MCVHAFVRLCANKKQLPIETDSYQHALHLLHSCITLQVDTYKCVLVTPYLFSLSSVIFRINLKNVTTLFQKSE